MFLNTGKKPIVECKTVPKGSNSLQRLQSCQHTRRFSTALAFPSTNRTIDTLPQNLDSVTNLWLTNVFHLILRDHVFHRLI